MPKQTFLNLNPAKEEKIAKILLDEFSENSLLDANVNRIVKAAGIARGSFYTYFEDLDDAYSYSLGQVMKSIHGSLAATNPYQATINFIETVQDNPYYNFLSNYYVVDEAILDAHHHEQNGLDAVQVQADVPKWLAEVAVHHLIRQYFMAPAEKEQILQLLAALNEWQTNEA